MPRLILGEGKQEGRSGEVKKENRKGQSAQDARHKSIGNEASFALLLMVAVPFVLALSPLHTLGTSCVSLPVRERKWFRAKGTAQQLRETPAWQCIAWDFAPTVPALDVCPGPFPPQWER